MRGQVPAWSGAIAAVVALVCLGVYLAQVSMGKANKLASVIELFIAAAGPGVTVYGLTANWVDDGGRQSAYASEHSRVSLAVSSINRP